MRIRSAIGHSSCEADKMENQIVIDATKRWISSIVVGLNLCPFARRVFDADRIRYVVTNVTNTAELKEELSHELKLLTGAPRSTVETTLLIHPGVLRDFFDYNDFLGTTGERLQKLGFEGVIQIASFHPDYQFAGTSSDAVENYTNRSPYPMLHLLREVSVTEVSANPDDLLRIPERNVETLRAIGIRALQQRLKDSS